MRSANDIPKFSGDTDPELEHPATLPKSTDNAFV
ncbi:hypothetical protein SAMN05518668_104448 [Sphingobium sp. YR657]|nr:hypothetical protein SAMN05518668_104448 [Sphingobium sp. YR657]